MRKLWATIVIVGTLLVGLVGCGDNASFFSDVRDEKTKIVQVLRQDGNTFLVDKDGDGVFETSATQGELEILEAEGREIRIIGG